MNELILSWRRHHGLSQREFAEKTGFSLRMVNRWETGKTTPEDSSIRRVAESLGLGYQEFLAGPDEYQSRKDQMSNQPQNLFQLHTSQFERLSNVYPLSGIKSPLSKSFWLGWSATFAGQENPKDWIQVFVDETGEAVQKGVLANVHIVSQEKTHEWAQDDVLLFYRPGYRAFIRRYREVKEGDMVLGLVTGIMQQFV